MRNSRVNEIVVGSRFAICQLSKVRCVNRLSSSSMGAGKSVWFGWIQRLAVKVRNLKAFVLPVQGN